MQDMRKRKAGLEVKERHGQTCVPGALLVRVDTVQAALALVRLSSFPQMLLVAILIMHEAMLAVIG